MKESKPDPSAERRSGTERRVVDIPPEVYHQEDRRGGSDCRDAEHPEDSGTPDEEEPA